MRILILANEHLNFPQTGFRRTFENLKAAGLVEDVLVLSPQLSIEIGAPTSDVSAKIFSAFKGFEPDVVFIMHPHKMGLSQELFTRMRETNEFRLILWEGDAYSLLWKQPSWSDIIVARNADVVFTVGKGSLERNFKIYGAKDVRWVPHCFETDRLHTTSSSNVNSNLVESQVTIIANRSMHRLRPAPGWRTREKFIRMCEIEFGKDLSVYGTGWSGASARGALEFDQQADALSLSKISANWDHYPRVPWYFSNRLPISLASGSVHATTFHKGYETIFGREEMEFLITDHTPEALIRKMKDFLKSKSQDEISELGLAAKAFAYKKFRQDDWIVKMLNFDGPRINLDAARSCWSV